MTAANEVPALVQAIYSFKGKNNDELNFKKGDIITITQRDEGGWWEGTLDGKTGWFPSNYVKEFKSQDAKAIPTDFPEEALSQQKIYRNLILKDIIDSESVHITELENFVKNILTPLETADILSRVEYLSVMGNILEVIDEHKKLLKSLQETYSNPCLEQRVGKIFLSSAAQLKTVLLKYCSSHPKAVCILEQHKDKLGPFVESHGGTVPGLIFLTAGLSRPFRRPERYAGSLQELERHMEESHPDRGDTQRSVHVYQDLSASCTAVRRQRELELEILSGSVRNWEGEEPNRLGELILIGAVTVVSSSSSETKERHLVLFTQALVFLSVTPCLSAFVYEGRLPVTGLVANSIEDSENQINAFEISGPGSERIIVSCASREDRQQWLSSFKKLSRPAASSPPSCHVSSVPYRLLTRYVARLLKSGVLTRRILREILDGGECQRRLLLADVADVSRFRRRCRVECHLVTLRKDDTPKMVYTQCWISPDSEDQENSRRSLYIQKEYVIGVPLEASVGLSRSLSSNSLLLQAWSSPVKRHQHPGRFRCSLDDNFSRSLSASPAFVRPQSLPPSLEGVFTVVEDPAAPDLPDEGKAELGAWVSNVSSDSGLADLGASQAPLNRPGTQCHETELVYRSSLYAHWWLKAKLSPSAVVADVQVCWRFLNPVDSLAFS